MRERDLSKKFNLFLIFLLAISTIGIAFVLYFPWSLDYHFVKVVLFSFFVSLLAGSLSYVVYSWLLFKKINGSKIKIDKLLPYFVVIMGLILYGVFAVIKHYFRFETFAADYGLFDQWIWKISRFKQPESTIYFNNVLQDHFQLIVYLLAPFYWFFNTSITLYFFGIVGISLGALGIYLLAKKELNDAWPAFICAVVYLFSTGNQWAISGGFVPTMLIGPFLIFAFYFYKINKYFWHFLFIFLALICKENVGLYVIAFGIFLIIKKRTLGLIHIILGLTFLWFALYFFPKLVGSGAFGGRFTYSLLGSSPTEALKTIFLKPIYSVKLLFDNPLKISSLIMDFGGFGLIFLLFVPSFLILTLPMIAERYWSSYQHLWQFDAYYGTPIAAILSIALVYSVRFLKEKMGSQIIILISFFLLYNHIMVSWLPHSPLHNLIHSNFYKPIANRKILMNEIAKIPNDVSVSAQNPIVPHLAHRDAIYMFPAGIGSVQYIILSKPLTTWPATREEYNKAVLDLQSSPVYVKLFDRDNVSVYKKIK